MEMHQGRFPGTLSSVQQQPAPHPGTGHCRLGTGSHFSSPQQHHNQHAYDGFTGDRLHFGEPWGTHLTLSQGGVRHSFGPTGNIGGILTVPAATGRYPSPPYVVGSAGFPDPASQGQLAASLQLQKLNTQYYNHQAHHPNPAAPASAPTSAPASNPAASIGHLFGLQQQELHVDGTRQLAGSKVTPSHHQVAAALAPPTPSVMDTDLVDEELLMALVLEMGLDRVQELPELWLGQNEFDFMTEFVYKQQQQQPSRISC